MTQQQLQYSYWQRLRQLQTYKAYMFGAAKNKKNSYTTIRNVSDNYFLNFIEYDAKNLDSQKAAQHFKVTNNALFTGGFCTGVHKGNMVLRHLDWYYNDQVEFIIKMNKCLEKGVKFDSIGMTAVSPYITTSNIQDIINNKTYNEFFDILPFATVDGVNEKGIYASSNVVEHRTDINNTQGFGESSVECCYSVSLVRFILDRLEKISDLSSLLNSLHLFSIKPNLMNYETHILVADSEGNSKIIEFIDKNYELTDYPVLTNFRTNAGFKLEEGQIIPTQPDWDSIEWNGIGVERWIKGMEFAKPEGSASFSAFKDLRYKLNYIQAYDRPYERETWLTDNLSAEAKLSVQEAKEYHDGTISDSRKQVFDNVLSTYAAMNSSRKRISSNKTWITTHSCIYDLSSMSCNIVSQLGTDECTEWNVLSTGLATQQNPTFSGKWTLTIQSQSESSVHIFNQYNASEQKWYSQNYEHTTYIKYSNGFWSFTVNNITYFSKIAALDAKNFMLTINDDSYTFVWSEI